jgi:regulator of sigma E protease
MEALIMAGQLILGLSILVGLHELGHLVAAKVFGMRVEQYSIGFPPKLFGFKYGETEYSLGAVPLGGFVKISGMVDESLDTDKLSEAPKPWEFRSKPAWQRLIVMMGRHYRKCNYRGYYIYCYCICQWRPLSAGQ